MRRDLSSVLGGVKAQSVETEVRKYRANLKTVVLL